MISKKLLLILSLCVAGSLVPAYGSACAPSGTLDTYIGTTCNIGVYTFTFVSWIPTGAATDNPPGGPPASTVTLSILLNAHGTGFLLSPAVMTAGPNTGNNDGELQYRVTGTGINSIYLEVDGSTTGTALDHVQDLYCLGGTTSPPAGNGFCPGNQPTLNESEADVGINNGQPSSLTQLFASQTSIAVQKDIDANGGTNGVASVTGVINQFGPAVVPEPGTVLLSLIGLGLLFFGKHKLSRS